MNRIARAVTILLLLAAVTVCVRTQAAAPPDVTLADGKLEHHRIGNDLFKIDELWIRVAENTEFHRWLSQGVNRKAAIVVTTNTSRLADETGARILTGTLIHETAPNPTPVTVDVVGQLPPGNLPTVHIVFLRDALTGTIGAVTLQTSDRATAAKFQGLDDAHVSIVIRLKMKGRRWFTRVFQAGEPAPASAGGSDASTSRTTS